MRGTHQMCPILINVFVGVEERIYKGSACFPILNEFIQQ